MSSAGCGLTASTASGHKKGRAHREADRRSSVHVPVLHMVEQLVGEAKWEPLPQRALDVPHTGEEDEAELYTKRATLF